jgi:hydrogenase expression/formation protein HypD
MLDIRSIINQINQIASGLGEINLMEVCGTHTVSIYRFGIHSLLPKNIRLVSGPGCPVCVTEPDYIDKALEYLRRGYKIATFGDMVKVPASSGSLEKEASENLLVVYSPLDALDYAKRCEGQKVIFLGVGFETTAPLIAGVLQDAYKEGISNFYLLTSLRLIPPAIEFLLKSGEIKIDGFILPGHVSTVIGANAFEDIVDKYKVPSVISGFEAEDIIESVYLLLDMIREGRPHLKVQYKRAVRGEGNVLAKEAINDVFDVIDINWRGLGKIERSALALKGKYQKFDIEVIDPVQIKESKVDPRCRCGDVIKGLIEPFQCPLFEKVCNPQNPYGPCMVSSEGSCSAYYKYGRR